jgi:hypothetical protein
MNIETPNFVWCDRADEECFAPECIAHGCMADEGAEKMDNGRNTGGKSYYTPAKTQCTEPGGCSNLGGPCPSCETRLTSGDPCR